MNMLKRSLAMILVLCMMVGIVPFSAFADESTDATSEPTVSNVDVPEGEFVPSEESEELSSEEVGGEITASDEPVEEEEPSADEPVEEEEPSADEPVVEEEPSVDEPVVEEPAEDEEIVEEIVEIIETTEISASKDSKEGITMGTKPDDGTTKNEPFSQGIGGSNSFRIPALVTLSDGTLVAAADARWNTTYDGGGLDTIVSRSFDDGANWAYTFANYLGDYGNEYNGANSTTFIDPALAVVPGDDSDTIYMLVDLYPYGVALNGDKDTVPSTSVGFNTAGNLLLSGDDHASYSYYLSNGFIYDSTDTAVTGYSVDEYFNIYKDEAYVSNLFFSDSPYKVVRTGFLYLTSSDDKGETWSEPTLLNLKRSTEQVCLVAPGRGLVTGDGMIVFPVYSFHGDNDPSGNTQRMSFIYSTDGQVWKRTAELDYNWASESAVVELEDETLRFFFRNGTTNLCYVDYANDAWGSVVNTGLDTNSNCQISAISLQKTINDQQVILVSCPTGPSEAGSDQSGASYRLNGKIFVGLVNADGTMSWRSDLKQSVTSNDSQFMYSCLTALTDEYGNETGEIAILYEDCENAWGTGTNCYYTMDFKTFDLSEHFDAEVTTDILVGDYDVEVTLTNTDTEGWTLTVVPDQEVAGLTDEYVAFDVTITKADGSDYTDPAEVTLPLGELTGKEGIYPFVVEANGTVTKITKFTVDSGEITFTAPHFSVVGAAAETSAAEITGEDTITSSGGTGTAYVLDTDGTVSATNPYLIVNTGTDGTGYALTNNSGTSGKTQVNISDGKITEEDASKIEWMFSGASSGTVGNNRYYLTPNYGSLTLGTTGSTLTVANQENGAYKLYRYYNWYYYLTYSTYSASWTGSRSGNLNSVASVYLYEKTEVSTVKYTVNAAYQESRIDAYNITNAGYTDDSWTAYQNALTAAQAKLTAVEGASYTSEAAATTALNELIAAVDALENAKNALVKAVYITARYMAGDDQISVQSMGVAETATSVSLPATITVDGAIYTVDNTTLTLTEGVKVYDVAVTKLEGYAISIPRGNELTISPSDPMGDGSVDGIELTTGQYVKWNTANSAYVGVAGVYDATNLVYTDEAVLHGTQEIAEPITVTATIYNADGSVASTMLWNVTVTAPDGSVTAVYRYYNVDQTEHCTMYYSVNGGELVQINGSGVAIDYVDPNNSETIYTVVDGKWYTDLSLIFFAAPDEGYALTHMYVEDSYNQYYVLSDGNGDVTLSSAWPLKDGVSSDAVYTDTQGHTYSLSEVSSLYLQGNTTTYEAIKHSGSVWKSLDTNNDGTIGTTEYHGLRWALLEGYMDINRMQQLYTKALALGCTGVTTVTKGQSTGTVGTTDDPISICAVAQKLPTIHKEITSITKGDGSTISGSDVENAAIEIGDTLNYKITVTIHKTDATTKYWDGTTLTSGTTATISYSNINVTDTLYDLNWSTTNTTSATTSTTSDKTLTSKYSITLASSNWLEYVEHGTISNEATLTYDYVAGYGTGSYGGESDAAVDAYVVLPEYVIDFGASIEIDLTNDPLVAGYDVMESATARYGDVTFDADTLKLTYTPNQILPGIDFIAIKVQDKDGSHENAYADYGVRIYPATTVYYEEGFIDYASDWDTRNVTTNPGTQTSEMLSPPVRDTSGKITGYTSGKVNAYGYDSLYDDDVNASAGTEAITTTIGKEASFTFTGTGFDVYANCTESSGVVAVQVKNSEGKNVKLYTVDTVVSVGETSATQNQTDDEFHLPVVSRHDLPHGTYTVTLKKVIKDTDVVKPVKIDGVRIYNTIKDSSVFEIDKEDDPAYFQLRDYVLSALDINDATSETYGTLEEMAEQVYADIVTGGEAPSAVVTSVVELYKNGETAIPQDLLDNGPKNELFLYSGQTLTFNVTTSRAMQIGLKAPRAETNYTLTYTPEGGTAKTVAANKALKSSVNMFYALGNTTGTATTYTVSVTNNGSDILSVTDLKICDDPNAAFAPLTVANIEDVLSAAGYEGDSGSEDGNEGTTEPTNPETPVEPEITYADAVAAISLVDYTGAEVASASLTANGVEGETKVFTAEEILAAVADQMPENYALAAEYASDVEVSFGETETVSVQIGKVATLKVTFVNLFGRKVSTATITKVQTSAGSCKISAAEIRAVAPAGRRAVRLLSTTVAYGNTSSVVVPVI